MVFHFTRLEAKSQRKVFLSFYEVENFNYRENQTKSNLFSIYPSVFLQIVIICMALCLVLWGNL